MNGQVWHARYMPVKNAFRYKVSYVSIPLSQLKSFNAGLFFGLNRPALISLYLKDYGSRGKQTAKDWISDQLTKSGSSIPDGEVVLVAMPRFAGYIFNPVCFWLCYDKENRLKAVLSEVNNTFGETHVYLCKKDDESEISKNDLLSADKAFHVSPFFTRAGGYQFRFGIDAAQINISIKYYSEEGAELLSTQLCGPLIADSKKARFQAVSYAPAISLISSLQIYWQAIRLKFKGLPWIPKPTAVKPNLSVTRTHSPNQNRGQ